MTRGLIDRMNAIRLCVVAIVVASGGAAGAQWPGDNVITEAIFTDACDALTLSEAQRKFAFAAHGRYTTEMKNAQVERAQTVRDVEERLGLTWREEWDSLSPMERMRARRAVWTPERRNERNRVVQEANESFAAQQRQARRAMIHKLSEVLSDSQLECLPAVERLLRRRTVARADWPADTVRQNLMTLIDLRVLLVEASEEGEEFDGLELPRICDCPTQARTPLAGEIAALLDDYETALDAHISHGHARIQVIRDGARTGAARGGSDAAALQRNRESAAILLRPFVLAKDTSRVIAAIAAPVYGDDAADEWRKRVDRAMFPVLFQDESPDHMYEWTMETVDLDEDQLAMVQAIYADYLRQRRSQREAAMDLELSLRTEGSNPGFRTNQVLRSRSPRIAELHDRYDENLDRRRALASTTNDRLRRILDTAETRLQFDEYLNTVRGSAEFPSHEAPP